MYLVNSMCSVFVMLNGIVLDRGDWRLAIIPEGVVN